MRGLQIIFVFVLCGGMLKACDAGLEKEEHRKQVNSQHICKLYKNSNGKTYCDAGI